MFSALSCPAIGFDLGETLLTYRETPLSWAKLYRPALERMAYTQQLALSEKAYASAEAVLARYNTRLHPRTIEISAEVIFSEILRGWEMSTHRVGLNLDQAADAFFGFFQQRLIVYPESRATLLALRAAGRKIGLLTDVPYGMPKRFVEDDLAKVELAGFFDIVLTSVEVGYRKPEVHGFLSLAERLEVSPTDMLYVGNESKDVIGAKAAGMRAVLIDREGLQPDFGQDKTIVSLSELICD